MLGEILELQNLFNLAQCFSKLYVYESMLCCCFFLVLFFINTLHFKHWCCKSMFSEVLYHFLLRGCFLCTKHDSVKAKVGGKGQGTADYMAAFAGSSPPYPLLLLLLLLLSHFSRV